MNKIAVAVSVMVLVVAAALALLPRVLLQQPHENVVMEKKTEVAVIVTDYCPTIEALYRIVDLYTTTDISVDVDQLYDPLENLRAETGCAFGVVRYPAHHFEEYERIPLPLGENIEFVIIRGTVTEGGYREVYALIDQVVEQEVVLETKADLDPAAHKASLETVADLE